MQYKNLKGKKIIIAGGAGFVGKNLVRVMLEEGLNKKDIIVIDKDLKNLDYVKRFGINTQYYDLSSKGDWINLFKDADILVNLAAQISSKDYEAFTKNNVIATQNLVDACKKHKVGKILHYSSASVLSVRKDAYAETKKQSEDIVRKSKIRFIALQPSLMYGPLDDKNIGWLINFASKWPVFPIPGSGKYPRQPIYIDDMCHLTINLMEKFPAGKILSINGKDTLEFGYMIKSVLNQMRGIHVPIHIPIPIFKFAMVMYQKIFGEKFTTDQVDSLTSGDVFPDYPWWDEFNVKTTTYEEGTKIMLKSMGFLKQ